MSGGSSETDVNELMVSPTGAFASPRVAATTTPVGKHPSVSRSRALSKAGLFPVITGVPLSRISPMKLHLRVLEKLLILIVTSMESDGYIYLANALI